MDSQPMQVREDEQGDDGEHRHHCEQDYDHQAGH
jgi:hypothetical protein